MNRWAHMANGNTASAENGEEGLRGTHLIHINSSGSRSRSRGRESRHARGFTADMQGRSFAASVPKASVDAACCASRNTQVAHGAVRVTAEPAEEERAGQPATSMAPAANRYRNSIDAALQGVMLEPPILQMDGGPWLAEDRS